MDDLQISNNDLMTGPHPSAVRLRISTAFDDLIKVISNSKFFFVSLLQAIEKSVIQLFIFSEFAPCQACCSGMVNSSLDQSLTGHDTSGIVTVYVLDVVREGNYEVTRSWRMKKMGLMIEPWGMPQGTQVESHHQCHL